MISYIIRSLFSAFNISNPKMNIASEVWLMVYVTTNHLFSVITHLYKILFCIILVCSRSLWAFLIRNDFISRGMFVFWSIVYLCWSGYIFQVFWPPLQYHATHLVLLPSNINNQIKVLSPATNCLCFDLLIPMFYYIL